MMKWYNQNIKELLSAYLDDELPKHEKDILEDKIISSPVLLSELETGKGIKAHLASLKRLPEDEYFISRLMERLKSEKSSIKIFSFFKKPVIAFGIISISLMGVLKFYPDFFPSFLSKQKSNLVSFYTQNLKPFIYAADLNSEDIFNFAFNNNLPLNKEDRQMLQLDRDANGHQFVEVKFAGNTANVFNFPQFVKSLKLNKTQKDAIDSILLSHSDEISSRILVNDKNTVAVSPSIWNAHNAVRSDLLAYVASVNKEVSKKIMPAAFEVNDVSNRYKTKKTDDLTDDTYFIFCPDTIFTQKLKINESELKNEIRKFKQEINGITTELNVTTGKNKNSKRFKIDMKVFPDMASSSQKLKVMIDANACRIQIPEGILSEKDFPNFDSVNSMLDQAFNNLRNFQFNMQFDTGGKEEVTVSGDKNKRKNLNKFEFKVGPEGFVIPNPDSLANFFRFYFQDSAKSLKFNNRMNQDMEVFKKEMEKFKLDMEKMRKEMQKGLKKNTEKKEPIEI